jgi:AraC-like DNA-binding protein
MSESNKNIPISTLRKKIRLLLKKSGNPPGQILSSGNSGVEFLPFDLKVWRGSDSDFFRRSFCHHRMILKVILSGRATTCIEGIRYELSPGEAVLYFPMQPHSTELLEENSEFEYLALSFIDGLGKYEALHVLRNRVFFPDPEGKFLPEIIQSHLEGDFLHSTCLLGEMLAKCVKKYSPESSAAGECNERFRAILSYMQEHSCEEISVKTIGNHFRLSPQTVRRIFRKYANNMTPGTLLRRQRLTLAQDLLERTVLPLEEIASRCGFANAFSFSRAFRKVCGVSPRTYRKDLPGKANR